MRSLVIPLSLAFIAIAALGVFLAFQNANFALGSVEVGSEYNATTTYAAHTQPIRLLKTGQGSINSVVITGENTGRILIYNATTSNANLRTGGKASSSITIADFPASTAEGTYTLDATFTDGLLIVTSGNEATSTITWR